MTGPLEEQIGGDHYKRMKIQPMEYSMANGLDACQHTIIKYVSRFRDKGGVEDLRKAIHCIEMLIEFEQKADRSIKSAPELGMPFDGKTLQPSSEEFYKGLAVKAPGWTYHPGHWQGPNMVREGAWIEVQRRDGTTTTGPADPMHWAWAWGASGKTSAWDVVAYRFVDK